MIQVNLLPDIKQEFVKVNRTKRMVVVVSLLIAAVLLVVFILLLSWDGLQKKNLNDINGDITTNKSQLSGMTNLSKILTIQNQLNSLPTLDAQKPVVSRFFSYLSQITPTSATVSTISADYGLHTITITGDADSLATVNEFADTLKFTKYSENGQSTTTLAFSDVVLSSFAVTSTGTTYTLTFNFDPNLFDSSDQITLTVPSQVTTRSETDQPTDLFKKATTTGSSAG